MCCLLRWLALNNNKFLWDNPDNSNFIQVQENLLQKVLNEDDEKNSYKLNMKNVLNQCGYYTQCKLNSCEVRYSMLCDTKDID